MSEKELKEIEEKIKSELEPFLEGITTNRANYEIFKNAYIKYKVKAQKSQMILNTFVPGKRLIRPKKEEMNEKQAAYLIFVYLGLVESFGNCIAEIVSMLLIANGNDFHIERKKGVPRVKHVTSIEDFERENISLGVKLAFLEDNNIQKLPKLINSKLRNSIAHFKFEIQKDRIHLKGQPKGQPVVPLIWENIAKLVKAIRTVNSLLDEWAISKGLLKKKVLSHE